MSFISYESVTLLHPKIYKTFGKKPCVYTATDGRNKLLDSGSNISICLDCKCSWIGSPVHGKDMVGCKVAFMYIVKCYRPSEPSYICRLETYPFHFFCWIPFINEPVRPLYRYTQLQGVECGPVLHWVVKGNVSLRIHYPFLLKTTFLPDVKSQTKPNKKKTEEN